MFIGLIKNFFLVLCCIYIFSKITNIPICKKNIFLSILFSAFGSIVAYFVKINVPTLIILVLFIFTLLFCWIIFKKERQLNFNLTIISLATSYIFFTCSFIAIVPLIYLPFKSYKDTLFLNIFTIIFAGIFQLLITFLFFRIKRFRTGIPNFENNYANNIAVFISVLVLLIASLLNVGVELNIFTILFCITIFSGFITYFECKKHITKTYQQAIHSKNMNLLEHTIEKQNEEIINLKSDIEKLSKIIHKDNKLIPSMVLAVKELCINNENKKATRLLTELEKLANERKGYVKKYECTNKKLTKTEIVSLDILINYLFQRATSNHSIFDFSVLCDVKYMISNILSESDLRTLFADLGENAIIATSNSKDARILITIGIIEDTYYISFFDNGDYFDANVILKMGKTKYTTHTDTGGSGIGLMQTFELMNKYNASFEIEEFNDNSLYKKRVSIIFDTFSTIKVNSKRVEILSVCSKRKDIILTN